MLAVWELSLHERTWRKMYLESTVSRVAENSNFVLLANTDVLEALARFPHVSRVFAGSAGYVGSLELC